MALETEQHLNVDCKQTVEEIEWNRLKEFRLKEGFVDGKIVGEESTFMSGYYHGYRKGFGICYPLNLARGLLFANKLLLIEKNQSSLLNRSEEIKSSLDEFEDKCNKLKLKCIKFSRDHISTDIDNDNYVDCQINEKTCSDRKETLNDELNDINIEFGVLKKLILSFVNDCQQPLLFDQISQIFEKWDCQQLTQSDGTSASESKEVFQVSTE